MGPVAVKALLEADTIRLEELKELVQSGPPPCVSIYMPAHRADSQIQQNPVRLRNLLRTAADRLLAFGLDAVEADEMLERAKRLVEESLFWQYQSDGLVLFLRRGWGRAYRLPLPFEERVIVHNRFCIKSLLPYFLNDGLFYALSLSQRGVRLFRGNRHAIDELTLDSVPQGMAEAQGPLDDIPRYFHQVDHWVCETLGDSQAPLVLAGVGYLLPHYRRVNHYAHLLDAGVPVNAQAFEPQKIHAAVWPVVEPVFEQRRGAAIEKYNQFSGEGRRSSKDTAEIVRMAHEGRVESLFLAEGEEQWGAFDLKTLDVRLHKFREPGDEDLTDRAATQTLLTRGMVYVMKPWLVPGHSMLSAVFRY